jgi:hypothetical protein
MIYHDTASVLLPTVAPREWFVCFWSLLRSQITRGMSEPRFLPSVKLVFGVIAEAADFQEPRADPRDTPLFERPRGDTRSRSDASFVFRSSSISLFRVSGITNSFF